MSAKYTSPPVAWRDENRDPESEVMTKCSSIDVGFGRSGLDQPDHAINAA